MIKVGEEEVENMASIGDSMASLLVLLVLMLVVSGVIAVVIFLQVRRTRRQGRARSYSLIYRARTASAESAASEPHPDYLNHYYYFRSGGTAGTGKAGFQQKKSTNLTCLYNLGVNAQEPINPGK